MPEIKLTYYGDVDDDGRIGLPKRVRKECAQAFSGKRVEVLIKKKRKRRSNAQNAYLFGVVYQMICDFLNSEGDDFYTTDTVHEICKFKFLRVRKIDEDTGELVYEYTRSTTELTTTEFSDYIMTIQKWAVDYFGLNIPDPNEQVEVFN